MTYVLLTTKPGRFRTEPGDGMRPVETWHYHHAGRLRASYVIAELAGEGRITIVDEEPPQAVNRLPSKFLPRYETLQAARDELAQLARGPGALLERVEA